MNKKIVILDYKMGNLFSVKNAFLSFGVDVNISSDKTEILRSDALIIPGVGAFGEAMANLNKHDLVSPILDYYQTGRPVLGICLGLQLLFEESEEFGSNKGLGIVKGIVKKFNQTSDNNIKVPHMGWDKVHSEVTVDKWKISPLRAINDAEFMYFVHSFYVLPDDKQIMLTSTEYGGESFCSSILSNNLFACQFHPEKSGKNGVSIFKNWSDSVI